MKCQFFLEMVIFILKWRNLKKMDRNQTKICPGQKFVANEYPGIYIYISIPAILDLESHLWVSLIPQEHILVQVVPHNYLNCLVILCN